MLDGAELRELGTDETISEPGFYRMPLARHHGQPCEGVSVTSSVLRTMELATPADVWAFHQLNPDRWETAERDALRTGRAMAALIEGGEAELRQWFRVLPPNKPSRPTKAQLDAYAEGRETAAARRSVEFWRDVERDPRDILSQAEWDTLLAMGAVLAADPAASAALGGEPEVTMAWYDEATQLWCLARPDQVAFSGMLSDYKKMAPSGAPFLPRLVDHRITQNAYDMQMAFAAEAFEVLTGEWPAQVGLVCQSGDAPHHVILREIDEETLRMAVFRNRRARHRFRECLDSGRWPGPGEHVGAYRQPDWLRERLLEEMNTEGAT